MSLCVHMRKILRVEVVPWEVADAEGEEDLFGVVYMTTEGKDDGEPVGTMDEAEKIAQENRGPEGGCVRRVEAHPWLKRRHEAILRSHARDRISPGSRTPVRRNQRAARFVPAL